MFPDHPADDAPQQSPESSGNSDEVLLPWQRGNPEAAHQADSSDSHDAHDRADTDADSDADSDANVIGAGSPARRGGVSRFVRWLWDAAATRTESVANGISGAYGVLGGKLFRVPVVGYAFTFLIFFAAALAMHFGWAHTMPGVDAYYHIRMGVMYRDRGPMAFTDGKFPWTQASIFRDNWADKEWLFHQTLVPFTLGWQEPPTDHGTLDGLESALVAFPANATIDAGTEFEVKPAAGARGVFGTFTIEMPVTDEQAVALRQQILGDVPGVSSEGKLYRGTLKRKATEAPFASGFAVSDGNTTGILLALATGVATFAKIEGPSAADAPRGARLSATIDAKGVARPHGTAIVGAAAPESPFVDAATNAATIRRFIAITHVRGQSHLPGPADAMAEQIGDTPMLTVVDQRALLDPQVADSFEMASYVSKNFRSDWGDAKAFVTAPKWPVGGHDTLENRGKMASAFYVALVLWMLFLVFRQNGLPLPWVLALLIFIGGDTFGWRFFMTRAHVFSIALMILAFHLALGKRRWPLALLAVIYTLGYTASHAILVLVTLAVGMRWLLGDVKFWRAVSFPVVTGVGVLVGMILHPDAGNYLYVFSIQNVAVYTSSFFEKIGPTIINMLPDASWAETMRQLATPRPNLRLGRELEPATTAEFITTLWPLWLLGVVIVFILLARGQRPGPKALVAFAAMVAWGTMFGLSRRFIEYFAPFSAIFFALAIDEIWHGTHFDSFGSADRRFRSPIAFAFLVAVMVTCVVVGMGMNFHVVNTYDDLPDPRDVALFMRTNLPEKATVFTTDWHDFVGLIHYNDRQHYLVSLDPNFMFFFAPDGRQPGEVWQMWEDIRSGHTLIPDDQKRDAEGQAISRPWAEIMREVFRADFVCCAHSQGSLLRNLKSATTDFQMIYDDGQTTVFRVLPAGSGTSN